MINLSAGRFPATCVVFHDWTGDELLFSQNPTKFKI